MTLTGIILGAVGLLILVVGAVTGVRLRTFLSTAAAAQGRVVGFVKQTSNEGGSSTHAQVEFVTADGQTRTFVENSQTFGRLSVGSAVPVRYDATDAKKARIATSGRLWTTPIVLLVLGVALLVVGVILMVVGD
jgi:acylphosphatase